MSVTGHAYINKFLNVFVCTCTLQGKRICSENQARHGSCSSFGNVRQQVINSSYTGFQQLNQDDITTPEPTISPSISTFDRRSVLTDISNNCSDCNSIGSKGSAVTDDNSIYATPLVQLNSHLLNQRRRTRRTTKVGNQVATNLLKRINEVTSDGKFP